MKDFALWVDFIQMLHHKKPASVVFLRKSYVGEIEWLRVTITLKAKWLRSKNCFLVGKFAIEAFALSVAFI